MNRIFAVLFKQDDGVLEKLDTFSKNFWVDSKAEPETIKMKFSQQGYEDKGYGHIEQIIANVDELLSEYFENLFYLNSGASTSTDEKQKYISGLIDDFKPNLIMFFLAAHLHDIGMKFPRIFESVAALLPTDAIPPDHIGKIIYDHHHYGSFIILLEMCCFKPEENWNEKRRFLKNLPVDEKRLVEELNAELRNVHKRYFISTNWISFEDFKVILAILCLLHKAYDDNTVQLIVRNVNASAVSMFNTWWGYFERGKKWTDKMNRRFEREQSNEIIFGNSSELLQGELLRYGKDSYLDLPLVEALLQYGDKTEISITRLARLPKHPGEDSNSISGKIPLEAFLEDTKYDYQEGYLCTPMAQKVISDFARARACFFIPVLLVNVETSWVEKETTGKDEDTPRLNIVIHYLRFDDDKDIFDLIRYQNEKEFYDLDFLQVIRFHIPAIIHYGGNQAKKLNNPIFEIKLKKEEHPFEKVAIVTLDQTTGGRDKLRKVIGVLKCFEDSKPLIKDIIYRIILPDLSGNLNLDREIKADFKKSLNYLMKLLDILGTKKINSLDSAIRFLQKPQNINLLKDLEIETKIEFLKILCSDRYKYRKTNLNKIKRLLNGYGQLVKTLKELLSRPQNIDIDVVIFDAGDTADSIKSALNILKNIEGKLKKLKIFPYSQQNRNAIQKLSNNAQKEVSTKQAFFKTADSDVPANFEIMAILNLLYQED